MTTSVPLLRDVFPHLRPQLSTRSIDARLLLALDDPEMFLVELVSSVRSGRLDLPPPLVRELELELGRVHAGHEWALATAVPGRCEADPLVVRQRRVDAVARRVRERHPRRTAFSP